MLPREFLPSYLALIYFIFGLIIPTVSLSGVDPMQRMEGLVMPGDVVQGHARFEKKCDKCHTPFDKGNQNKLCRDCHEQIDIDVKNQSGYHGHIHNVDKRQCHSCHTDHQGRNVDIVQFDKEVFNHSQTNFKLNGTHASLACNTCHTQEKQYRMPKKNKCVHCHEKDDLHKGRLGKKCENCHTEIAWLPSNFNHNKTGFPLRHNHRNVNCKYCHVNERYDDTPKNCYFCHYLDDVHNGDRGVKCHECHYDERWSRIEFSHDDDTGFKIKNAHKRLICKDCHEKNVFKDELKTTCYSCHKEHDSHYGTYGKRCDICHTEKQWLEITFKHDKDTSFALKGEHKDVVCAACHKGHLFNDRTSSNCADCHRLDDVHGGQEGDKCTNCHNEKSWIKKTTFDHDLTKFPLHGSHPLLTCEDCHATGKYQETDVLCYSCHKKDDIHKKRLATKCEQCHGPSDWLIWEFDHDETDYPLDGAHDGLDCHACHTDEVKDEIELPIDCYGCHDKDDNHEGHLGRHCDKCHVTSSFKEIEIK